MKILDDFKKFALRGNLVELAIGFTVGAAFTTVAQSIVKDIIMPPIGLLIGGMDFADLFVVLRRGTEELPPYATLQDAQTAGAVTLNYGLFINNVIALLLVAVVMFILIRIINRMEESLETGEQEPAPSPPTNKKCPYCRQTIDYEATRCAYCTSQLTEPSPPPRT